MATTNFFISYTGADGAWAEWIAWQLEAAGYTITIQAWDSRPGNDFVAWMDQQVRDADRILVVLSPAYEQATSFTVPEWTAAVGRDPTGRLGVLVPVRVADFTPGGLFRTKGWIDLAGKDRQAGQAALLAGVRRERMKPTHEPPFPGERAAEPVFPGRTEPVVERAWNVPFERNPVFTGRQQLLDRLDHALSGRQGNGPVRVALTGMGGVGKTAVAVEYAHAHRAEYSVVWWLRGEQPETVTADLAALAGQLSLPEAAERDQRLIVEAVGSWLATHDQRLLVFDNAENADRIAPSFPKFGGCVLVTSRDPAWRRYVTEVLPVDVLERADAVEFLQRRTGERDVEVSGQLAEALGDLPLALEQAGAYCETEQLPMGAYLERFRSGAEELVTAGTLVDYADTVATTWTVALDKVTSRTPVAPALMRLLAYLGPDDAPWDLLAPKLTGLAELPGPLAGSDRAELDHALGTLGRYSLVKRTGSNVAVHRLVQLVVRSGLNPDEEQAWASAAVRLLVAVFPEDSHWPQTWPVCQRLLSHALIGVGHAEQLQPIPDSAGVLLRQIGRYFRARARNDTARKTFDRAELETALAHAEAALGPDHAEIATHRNNLGLALQALGDLPGARAQFERALAIAEAAHGSAHPDVATMSGNLGAVLQMLGDLPSARAQFERALAIGDAIYGPDHPPAATSRSNLGSVLRELGDLDGARALLERALAIDEAAYGPDHPNVARDVNNLGGVQQAQGDLDGARANYQRALRILQAAYGHDHLSTRTVADSLALLKNHR